LGNILSTELSTLSTRIFLTERIFGCCGLCTFLWIKFLCRKFKMGGIYIITKQNFLHRKDGQYDELYN